MRPVRLRLKGFTSFKDEADVSFANLDRFAICGPTGAGKSSLLDALTFALFAEAPRRGTGNLADLISLGQKSFFVILDFSVGEQSFRVTRRRRRSGVGNDQLEKVAGDKAELIASRERTVTETVEKLLGLNYNHFTQAVFLPQGKFSEFLKAKPADRRRVLNELLRLSVYARMQDRAGKDRDQHESKKTQTIRRLTEDFHGVTEEARADLERQQQEQLHVVAETDAELPGLRDSWEKTRCCRAWTIEWETKQAERTRHEAELSNIEAAREAVDAANRAAEVIPWLDQADAARQEEQRRQQALRQAVQVCEQRRAEHQSATAALEQAAEAVASLPDLRGRLDRLNIAKGKLGLRDQLSQALEEHQQRQALLAADHAATSAFAETLANEIAAIEQDLIHAGTNLEAIGFYEESLRRLTSEQPAAIRLQSERLQLARVREQAQQVEASAVKLDGAAEAAGRTACQEEAAAASAREHMEGAEEALRTAEAEHAAAHLRTGLRPGNACPVCRQEVSQVPTEQTPPELNQVHQACGAAKSRLTSAERNAAQAAKAFAAASATADAARTRASSSRSELDHRQQDFAHKEQALLEKVGDLLDPSSPAPVEEQALAAGQAASARHALYLQAAQRLNELQTQLALKKKDCESRSGQIARLDADLRATMAKIAVAREALIAVRNEIYLAAGTDEPAAEAERLQAEIALLEAAVARTTQAERTASERLRLAEASMNNCAQEASQASAHAAAVWATTAIALQKSGFTDAGAARAAHRPASQIRTMRERITAYEAISRALDHRIAELETALQGRRVSAAECLPAEQALEACVQRRKVAETQAAVFGQQLQHMQGRLERAKQLREELAEQEQLHHIYDRLAHDLRNDQFQAYLLEETLIGLLSNASCQLSRLTGERYGLLFRDERIIVIDHDNAGECRGIDTLSGGELFLASLALALALSEQVQKAAGAVHLDCLFIDEGFGTLDPETLRTVSDAIRGLQVGGRMVGIITHVPELKDEFEQQIIVEKQDGTSCVH